MPSELEDLFSRQARELVLWPFVREYRFCPNRRWRFDFFWPSAGLAVEIEGGSWIQGRHQRGSGFESDAEKYLAAIEHGFLVLRVTGKMVKSGRAAAAAGHALGLGQHLNRGASATGATGLCHKKIAPRTGAGFTKRAKGATAPRGSSPRPRPRARLQSQSRPNRRRGT